MKKAIVTKTVSLVVAFAFLVSEFAYGLSTMPGSTQTGPGGTVERAYALGQKLFASRIGPGAQEVVAAIKSIKPGVRLFTPQEEPMVPGVKFVAADYKKSLPKGWENNGIYEIEDLKTAFKYFRKHEAQIPEELLPIEVGTFPVKEGELPFACIEERRGKYVLVIHKSFVELWNDIRKNDVWFEYTFPDGEKRTSSLAWGIFYRVAKHEMGDIAKLNFLPKSDGHFNYYPWMGKYEVLDGSPENEFRVNQIAGRYNILNDAMWAWLLGAYCFNDNTRYNNVTLTDRLNWFFDGKDAQELNLHLEFPNLLIDRKAREYAIRLACGINYQYFARWGSRAVSPDRSTDMDYYDREVTYGPLNDAIFAAGNEDELSARDGMREVDELKKHIEHFRKVRGMQMSRSGHTSIQKMERPVRQERRKKKIKGRIFINGKATRLPAGLNAGSGIKSIDAILEILNIKGNEVYSVDICDGLRDNAGLRMIPISPAVDQSAGIFGIATVDLSQWGLFITTKDAANKAEEETKVVSGDELTRLLATHVRDAFPWSARAKKAFIKLGVETVADLVEVPAEILLETKNVGEKTFEEIRANLATKGLKLRSRGHVLKEDAKALKRKRFLSESIRYLFLGRGAEDALSRNHIWTVERLLACSADELLRMKGFEEAYLSEVRSSLASKEFYLRNEDPTAEANSEQRKAGGRQPGKSPEAAKIAIALSSTLKKLLENQGWFMLQDFLVGHDEVTKAHPELGWTTISEDQARIDLEDIAKDDGTGETTTAIVTIDKTEKAYKYSLTYDGTNTISDLELEFLQKRTQSTSQTTAQKEQSRETEFRGGPVSGELSIDILRREAPRMPIEELVARATGCVFKDTPEIVGAIRKGLKGSVKLTEFNAAFATAQPRRWIEDMLRIFVRAKAKTVLADLFSVYPDHVEEVLKANEHLRGEVDALLTPPGQLVRRSMLESQSPGEKVGGLREALKIPSRPVAEQAEAQPATETQPATAETAQTATISAADYGLKPDYDHQLPKEIMEFTVQTGEGIGPGSEEAKLANEEIRDIWKAINLLEDNRIEIILPQRVGLTETTDRGLTDVEKHIRERERKGAITRREYSSAKDLANILRNRPANGVKRIVVTVPQLFMDAEFKEIKDLASNRPEIFAGTRLHNVALPDDYSTMPQKVKTFYQARMIMEAVLIRLYEKDGRTPMVESILTGLLEGRIGVDCQPKTYLDNVVESEEETNPDKINSDDVRRNIIRRVNYCLDRMVSFSVKVAEGLDHLKLIMREFWTAA